MKALLRVLLLLAVAALPATALPAWGVEPDEMLDDPVLEQRARDLSAEIRCVVCQNETITSPNAEIASQLPLLVRRRPVAGDRHQQSPAASGTPTCQLLTD